MNPLTITSRSTPAEVTAEASQGLLAQLIAYGRLCYIKHCCPFRIASLPTSFVADIDGLIRTLRGKYQVQVYFTDDITTRMWGQWWGAMGLPEKGMMDEVERDNGFSFVQ